MAKVTSPEVGTRENYVEQFLDFCLLLDIGRCSYLSFPGWDQLVQSVHGIQGCFYAPVSSSLMLRVLLLRHLSNYFQPLSEPFVLIKTVCRDGEIIECFKRTREVGGIAQVRLVDRLYIAVQCLSVI